MRPHDGDDLWYALETIGFYTLTDTRALQASSSSPMWRTELLVTDRCNFSCPYCRGLRPSLRGDMPINEAKQVLDFWTADGLVNLRFSGGEPTLYYGLEALVRHAKIRGVERVALSTNGSAELEIYERLVAAGVDDFSISLDACCASGCESMSGGIGNLEHIVTNIEELARQTYVTVGIVLTKDNMNDLVDIVMYADSLGIADIRIIPAAQEDRLLNRALDLPQAVLRRHPILAYRVHNIAVGRGCRGLRESDAKRCSLALDDSAVAGGWHFPCVIYLREGGSPIGRVGPKMRKQREWWATQHRIHDDPICSANCLDVCIDYNNRYREYHR